MAVVAGIDIGAGTAKAVILSYPNILAYQVSPTGHDSVETSHRVMEAALKTAAKQFNDLKFIVATGYSRSIVPFANRTMTEITCHARGAHFLIPEAKTVIDMGCQDSKAIRLDENGMVANFVMNDKCAAGTGRFIEVVAQALSLKIEEVGPVALTSRNSCEISSTCTVFAETEIVSRRAQGRCREDLVAGALKAIAKRVSIMASGIGLAKEVVFTGGVAKNSGMKYALEETFGLEIVVPAEPQIVGALGAALYANDAAGKSKRHSR